MGSNDVSKTIGDVDLSGTLDQIAKATSSLTKLQAQLQGMIDKRDNDPVLDDAYIVQVCSDARRLADACRSLESTTESFIFGRLTTIDADKASLPRSRSLISLFDHFKCHIKDIIRESLPTSSTGTRINSSMWKIAEACYHESRDGKLNPPKLLLTGIRDIADSFPPEVLQQAWTDFWARKMMEFPSGPTLFRPHIFGPSARNMTRLFPVNTELPRYLFRAFDHDDASGGGSGAVVSGRWQREGKETLGDILSLKSVDGFRMLRNHLSKSLFKPDWTDNLKSWSSSLIFVIQYAIWRTVRRGVTASEVKICVVDTTKFPPVQFVRDRWLLRAYENVPLTPPTKEDLYIDLRLYNEAYNNGEFLSQGRVDLEGRSSVFSLAELLKAGLGRLYPQFFDIDLLDIGWPNRVKSLRSLWCDRSNSSEAEIGYAISIAQSCFGDGFDRAEIALLLLAFKDREVASRQEIGEDIMPDEPVEVRRYTNWTSRRKDHMVSRGTRDNLQNFFLTSQVGQMGYKSDMTFVDQETPRLMGLYIADDI
ncbi:hypothetical protein F5X68DRAFT_261934 [Plectosphaerella plurivora]|uniref:DUF7587 domain-containing protein n=1 Tax=Plectosphaerella plurivora TaxID=936078 RepID=A0A9P9AAU9_9PEZI|nr:hypothetical protein F5X68DRAFT_261934 [Plectosphaerella plurivora]